MNNNLQQNLIILIQTQMSMKHKQPLLVTVLKEGVH